MARRRVKSDNPPSSAKPSSSLPIWLGLLGMCLAAYYPAISGGVLWDDPAHITRVDLQSWAGLGRIWFEIGATQQYYPVLHSAFWFEHRLWGDAVAGYHAVNILLHAISAGLIVVLVRKLKLKGGWLAGCIFALHPVAVESVAWISEQKNTLSTAFYLLALLAWLRFEAQRESEPKSSGTWRTYILASLLFGLAVLSKTVTVTLPAAILVLDWWRRGSLSWRRDVVPLLPWFVFAIAAGLMTAWVERNIIGAEGEVFALTLLQRCLLAGNVAWFYFGKLVWPIDLIFIYPRWDMEVTTVVHFIAPLTAIAGLVALWFQRHRNRGPLAAALLFGGTLFPALGFFNVFPFQFSYVADHFQYLACIAIIVPVAAGLTLLADRYPQLPVWSKRTAAGILLSALGFLSWQQTHEYRDNITLYRATLEKNPASLMATYNLGMELAAIGEVEEAITYYRKALKMKPDYAEIHANLAMALMRNPGHEDQAIAAFREAIRLKPELWQASLNLANLLLTIPGHIEEVIQLYRAVLKFDPSRGEVRSSLGYAIMQVPGREQEALGHLEAALKFIPDDWSTHYQISRILLNRRPDNFEALVHLELVVQSRPDFAAARYHLAKLLLYRPTRRDEAIRHLQTALLLEPSFEEARSLLSQVQRRAP